MSIDWDNAPEGATHAAFLPDIQQHLFFKFADDRWFDVKNQEWSCIGGKPNFDLIERSKTLTQAVFDGLPVEYQWAAVDRDGDCFVFGVIPEELEGYGWGCEHGTLSHYIGEDFNTTNWQNSLIERQDVSSRVEQLRSVEAARKHSHYFKDVSGVDKIDLYHVARLYDITDPALFHAFKKIACAGKRGAKDQAQDVQEAIDALQRWQELNK